jgi:hydrogenase expression/formation protein HypC
MCLAIPGRVLDISGEDVNRAGRVDFAGVVRQVSLAAVPEARVGDYVIVHAGFALHILDEDEARATLEALSELAAAAGDATEPAPDPASLSPGEDPTS